MSAGLKRLRCSCGPLAYSLVGPTLVCLSYCDKENNRSTHKVFIDTVKMFPIYRFFWNQDELFCLLNSSFLYPGCFGPVLFWPDFWGESFRSSLGGSFRPYFIGGLFHPDFWGEWFRPDLFIMGKHVK